MPILAAETSIYPSNLLEDFSRLEGERQWWVVYTKARQEKALARHLLVREIPFYLPLVAKEQCLRGRKVSSHIPLFGGYVFLYGHEEERIASLMSNRISTMLPVADADLMFGDLRNVQHLIDSDAPLTVERRLAVGDRVRVKAGSMQGLEGVILKRCGKTRLQVAVSFLQQGVSIEIDSYLVEPLL
jgi:transcriptional antiterminator RfaH